MATYNYFLPLPEIDSDGTPVEKMPNCPRCGEDELGLIGVNRVICYLCSAVVFRKTPTTITAVPASCSDCSWLGTVGECEPNEDGELTCPQCRELLVVKLERDLP